MKILNTTDKLTDLKGGDLVFDDEPLTLDHAMGQILAFSKKNHLKAYVLAQKFYSEEEVVVDDTDWAFVKEAVGTSETFSGLVTGQVLQRLESQRAAPPTD